MLLEDLVRVFSNAIAMFQIIFGDHVVLTWSTSFYLVNLLLSYTFQSRCISVNNYLSVHVYMQWYYYVWNYRHENPPGRKDLKIVFKWSLREHRHSSSNPSPMSAVCAAMPLLIQSDGHRNWMAVTVDWEYSDPMQISLTIKSIRMHLGEKALYAPSILVDHSGWHRKYGCGLWRRACDMLAP